MAFRIENPIQDNDVTMARSTIVYTLDFGTDPLPVDFYNYVLEVIIWRGSISTPTDEDTFTLAKRADGNDNGNFDISKLLEGYFTDLDYNLPGETTGNLVINYRVSGYWIDAADVEYDRITRGTVQAQNGYNYFTDNVNHVIPNNDDGFLTDMPDIQYLTATDGRGYLSTFVRRNPSSWAIGYKIVADTGYTETIPFTTTFPPTSSEQTLLIMHVGYESLTTPMKNAINDYYDVWLYGPEDVQLSRSIRYALQEECKYTMYKVDWINRYGVWDRLFCYGNNDQKTTLTSGENAIRFALYNPDNTDEWKQGDGQHIVYSKNGKERWILNTGWVSEDFNTSLNQLFLAERVVVDGHSALLVEKDIRYKTLINDKLINYTFTFEFAFSTINTIK